MRSLRYPGLIGYKAPAGGGTTDYAVEIFKYAKEKGHYTCFLSEHTRLPMMFMDDAIKATIDITEAPKEQVKEWSSYNLSAFSFTPQELVEAIQKELPNFTCDYAPDHRQAIAESWPSSIDDSRARVDWHWQPDYNLEAMVKVMLEKM